MARIYKAKEYKFPTSDNPHTGEERNKTSMDNRDVKNYLNDLNYSACLAITDEVTGSATDFKGWLDDCLYGAAQQADGHSHISRGIIYGMLTSLDTINSATVGAYMNRKRLAFDEKPYSPRHINRVTSAVRCASDAVRYHSGKPVAPKRPQIGPARELPYSDTEKAELRRLSINGSFDEYTTYQNTLKAKYMEAQQ